MPLGVIEVIGVNAASQQTIFIVSGSQSTQVTQMLLGVIEVLGLMLLCSKLFLLSLAPNPSNARGS